MTKIVDFSSVWKRFARDKWVVKNLTFSVEEGETLVLLGQSGCGKTTTLKMVNRLLDPDRGDIDVMGKRLSETDPVELRRHIGYAIQHIGLFPHMTIEENVGLVPSLLGWDRKKIKERIMHLLEMVGLDYQVYLNRYPRDLSGGQRQRIGVARALAADPPIVLMDEPFGALDPITREEIQNEFIHLKKKLKKTILFVTHDVFEAVKVADRLAIMAEGEIKQIGKSIDLIKNPSNEFVRKFFLQHKFQLYLLTKAVRDFISTSEKGLTVSSEAYLNMESSVLDALDMFRSEESDILEVREENRPVGFVRKKDLINFISNIL